MNTGVARNAAMLPTARTLVAGAAARFAAAGIVSARLDAELLLGSVVGWTRAQLAARRDEKMLPAVAACFEELVSRRERREPVAYILGRREFFGREFRVTPDVLIPRPETETVVEALLGRLSRNADVLDIGTGSGAIAVTVAAERPDVRVTATDISQAALEIAAANAAAAGVSARVRFLKADLFPVVAGFRFGAIVSNPPYIAEGADLPPQVANYEPHLALFGGRDGLGIIRRIFLGARSLLVPGGLLVMEIGEDQGKQVRELAFPAGYGSVEILPDLSGADRMVRCLWPGGNPEQETAGG